ncbi:MAG: hypothetical protein Q9177_005117 [Variospora cf. flavescens]
MSLKREGTGEATDAQLSRILRDHYAGDPNHWFTAPRIPYLGEARGKIVLIRRFGLDENLKQEWGGAGWGINAENWADNTPNATCPSGDICVQDFYEVLETVNIEKKIQYSQAHLERAARCVCTLPEQDGVTANQSPKQPFFINFLTASNFWKVGCWPEKIAAKLNPAIVDFLCRKHNEIDGAALDQVSGDGSTGIVRTMLPPRAEKKRLVSRPLSPTHKRHKLAQYAQQTQASSRLNTLLLSPKQTLEDISPDLQFSQSDDSTKRRKVPHASALTHKLEIRSRPLRPEVDYKALEARNTNSRPLLPHKSPVSDAPVHHHHMSNALEEKQPRADSSKAANASTKAGLLQAQSTHWFWASEMPAIRDHILRARKERAKAARTKPVQTAGTPTSPSLFRPALTAQTVLPSPELSVSPSLPCAPSPLDLGSPDSIDEFQMNLRSVRVRTGERPMTDQDHLDHSLVTTSASPKARTVRKFSVQRGSFDRSSCPSPDPPPRYEESNQKGLRSSTKTTDPAPTTTSCNGSISESVSTCKDTNGNQEKCPTGFRNDPDQTKAKMTMPHLPRALNRVNDRPHSTSLGAGRNAPILSCEVQVRSRNPSGACSAWNGCYRGHQHCTGAWDAKSKHPLLHSWNEAYGQFQAPEPLIVFSVTMNDATMPVISVNRDGEVNNAGAETSNQQRETSNPRNVSEEPTAHVQRASDDGLNSLQGTSDPRNISEEPNAQVPAPSRDGEPMEPFPNITESLLRYSESTTNANPYEVTTEDKVPVQDHAPAQISLTDCLACSGCVTSAEAVLVSLQSSAEVLDTLNTYPSIRSQIDDEGPPPHGASNGKIFVASVSPQVRASIAATYGISQRRAGWMIDQLLGGPSGLASGGVHRSGFSWIVDTNAMREACLVLGADEVSCFLPSFDDNNYKASSSSQPKKPILCSACPGWICYAEKTHPHVLPHLSRLKSPQALTGTLLKTVLSQRFSIRPDQIWHLALMPCFDKKLEASREELTDLHWRPSSPTQELPASPTRDVDCVITARELLMLADSRGISFPSLPQKPLPASSTPPFPDTSLDAFLFPHRQPHSRKKRQRRNQDPSAGPSGGYLHHILQSQLALHPNSTLQTTRGRNTDVVEYAVVTSSPSMHSNTPTFTKDLEAATTSNGAAPQTPDPSNNTILFRAARYYGSRNIANLVRKLKPPKPRRLPLATKNPSSSSSSSAVPSAVSAGAMAGYAYVEVMACPGGCTNGGGQIKVDDVGPVAEGVGQREWLGKVDEAYYSMSDDDDLSDSPDHPELLGKEEKEKEEDEEGREAVHDKDEDDGTDESSSNNNDAVINIINGIDVANVRRMLAHWSKSTGIALEKLCFTTFREVKSEVGKADKKGGAAQQQDRVVEQLAGKIGGGW